MTYLIDVGAQAIDRATMSPSGYTFIAKENPVNVAGILKKVAFFFDTAASGLKVAIFTLVNGNTFTTRSYAEIGSAPVGYSEYDVDLAAQPGDFIGYSCTAGYLDRDDVGEGYWYLASDEIPCTDRTFTFGAARTASLFGWTPIPPIVYSRFLITAIQHTPNCQQVTTILTTDVPCHLWLRFTDIPPRKHPKTVITRGLAMGYDIQTCFVAFKDIEQEEAGDTLEHTFIITNLDFCHAYHFYFWGLSADIVMTYTSAIFNFFYPFGIPPFKTCEKQEESDNNWGFCQYWNAQCQTFTPTHTFKVHHLSLMLNQHSTDRRGPYCVKITRDIPPCWDEPILAIQRGYSTTLPAPGVKQWVNFYDITPILLKDTTYRIVVHTLPGWQVYLDDEWHDDEAAAAMSWWAKVVTNPYPRGMAWHGCNFLERSGYWIAHPNNDFTFVLYQICPSVPS
ncbi:hypothetical protein ES708_28261 [subsurface metagenome]